MEIPKFINFGTLQKIAVLMLTLGATAGAVYFTDENLYASVLNNQVAVMTQEPAVSCEGYPNPAPFITNSKVWWSASVVGVPNPSAVEYKWSGDDGLSTSYSYDSQTVKTYTTSGYKHATVTADMAELGIKTANCTIRVNEPNVPYQNPYHPLTCTVNPSTPYIGEIVTWSATVGNVTDATLLTYTWTGAVTGTGQSKLKDYSTTGIKTAYVSIDDGEIGQQIAACSVQVQPIEGYESDTTQEEADLTITTQSSTSTQTQTSSTGTTQQTTTSTAPAPDLITCELESKEVILSEKIPAKVVCNAMANAYVTAQVVSGDYKPPAEPAAESIVKTIFYNAIKEKDKAFHAAWNGIDSYDSPVEEGDYAFVISARKVLTGPADYSVQKFKVLAEPPPVQTQETQETQENSGSTQQPPAGETQQAVNPEPAPAPAPPPPPPEPSKCPGVNYPTDIAGHWAEQQIKAGFDGCMFKGYSDGTFHPDVPVTRAEGLKMALAALGIPPKTGCYDNDCGSPFSDLDSWQGPWVRVGYDLGVIEGETLFRPNDPLTRAEATALVARVFKFAPHQGCYTPNCGAGFPDNLFEDIVQYWQGPWIRALWDLGLVKGTGPNKFSPDRAITRAEISKIILEAKTRL